MLPEPPIAITSSETIERAFWYGMNALRTFLTYYRKILVIIADIVIELVSSTTFQKAQTAGAFQHKHVHAAVFQRIQVTRMLHALHHDALAAVKLNILFARNLMNAVRVILKRVIPMHVNRKTVKMPRLGLIADLVIGKDRCAVVLQ